MAATVVTFNKGVSRGSPESCGPTGSGLLRGDSPLLWLVPPVLGSNLPGREPQAHLTCAHLVWLSSGPQVGLLYPQS